MKVKVLPGHAVVVPGKTLAPGETLRVNADEGKRLVGKGVVAPVDEPAAAKKDKGA